MNILFDFENDPFSNDLSAQYARMALSVSMEHKVTMVYRKDAVMLSMKPFSVSHNEFNYFDHERFLVELEVDMFVLHDDDLSGDIKTSVLSITSDKLDELYQEQDLIFRN